jgi:hypothetical protein
VTDAEIQALVNSSCSPCHVNADGSLPALPIPPELNDITALVGVNASTGMAMITAGSRADSYLFHKVAGTQADVGGGGRQMPTMDALGAPEQEMFGAWIDGLE